MRQAKDKYSLWIIPSGKTKDLLQDSVNKLANDLHSPRFTPHITLVANIFATAAERRHLETQLAVYAQNITPFVVHLTNFGYKDEKFRSLFLLAASHELSMLYKDLLRYFPQIASEHFCVMPHLSVLYGDHSAATKQRTITEHIGQGLQDLAFEVNSLYLCQTNDPIENWRVIREWPFGGSSLSVH